MAMSDWIGMVGKNMAQSRSLSKILSDSTETIESANKIDLMQVFTAPN